MLIVVADMETQNITLTLPRRVLRQVKTIAAKRHTSVSRLLTEQLEIMIADEQGYTQARTRHLALRDRAPDLGTGGRQRIAGELGTGAWSPASAAHRAAGLREVQHDHPCD